MVFGRGLRDLRLTQDVRCGGLLFNPPSHTGQFQFAQEAFSVAFLYGGGLRATLKPQSTTSTTLYWL